VIIFVITDIFEDDFYDGNDENDNDDDYLHFLKIYFFLFNNLLGRIKYKKQMVKILSLYVDIPAAIRIQRIYRGRIAKFILKQLKIEMKAILCLQKNFRIIVNRKWEKQIRHEKKRKSAVILIQKYYRGTLDRQLYRYKYHIKWYKEIYIPSLIKIQSHIRRYQAMNIIYNKKRKNNSARFIQYIYHNYKDRVAARLIADHLRKMKIFNSMAKIQCNIRRMLAYKKFKQKLLIYKGMMMIMIIMT
jgi:hypothetical protein